MTKKKVKRKYSKGGSIGTLVGAGVGSFVPGIGTAAGAGIGGSIGSLFGGRKKEPTIEQPQSFASGTTGYKKGGRLKKYRKGGKKKYPLGGTISPEQGMQVPLGPGANRYEGPQHEQGGIPVTQTGKPTEEGRAVAEVEGGETSQRMDGETFIFSDELMVPETDMTFAEAHEMLVQEGASEEEIEQLKAIQEQVRQQEEGVSPEQEPQMEQDAGWGEQAMFATGGKIGNEKGRFRRNLVGKRLEHGGTIGQRFRDEQIGAAKGNQKSNDIFKQREQLRMYKMGGRLPMKKTGGPVARNTSGRWYNPNTGRMVPAGDAVRQSVTNPNMSRLYNKLAPHNPEVARTRTMQNVFGQTNPINTRTPSVTDRVTRGISRGMRSPVGRFAKRSIPGAVIAGGTGAYLNYRDRKQQWEETGIHPSEQSVIQRELSGGSRTTEERTMGEFNQNFGLSGEKTFGFDATSTGGTGEPIARTESSAPAPIQPTKRTPKRGERIAQATVNPDNMYFRRKGGTLNKMRLGGATRTRVADNPYLGVTPPEPIPQPTSLLERGMQKNTPDFKRTVGSGTTDRPDLTKYAGERQLKSPNWGNLAAGAAFAAPAISNLLMASRTKKPQSVGRVTHVPLSTSSPAFRNMRGQARAGYRTAIDGGAQASASHAQYLQGMSGIAAQEADFTREREDTNEQLRRQTEAQNLQLRAQDYENEAAFKANRMGLIADAIEQPLGSYLQHRRGMATASARISDPDERKRFEKSQGKLFGFRKGGKLKKAYRKGGRLNYPLKKVS